MKKQLFIVGAGRSGTTLLQTILNAHSQVAFSPESHFLRKYVFPQIQKKKAERAANKEWLIDLLNSDNDFRRLDTDPKKIAESNIDFSSKTFFVDVFNEMGNLYLEKSGKSYFGDKDPMNLNHLKQLKQAFPKAHVIHIIRDPRDVVMSRMKTEWGKKYPFFVHVFDYGYHVERALEDGPAIFGKQYHQLRYEDLLTFPEVTIKSLCGELDIEFEDQMLLYHENGNNLVNKSEKEWKDNVDKPIISDNLDKWKKGMSRNNVMLVESICSATINKLGYSTSGYTSMMYLLFLALPFQIMYYLFSLRKSSIEN
ncbi:MAG: sulfotransferase [Bacteroidetes bacterium]|nr:sulfotransferase [Bacteroidota bacterium]